MATVNCLVINILSNIFFFTMNLLDDLEDILKNVAIDFHNIENTMEVNG